MTLPPIKKVTKESTAELRDKIAFRVMEIVLGHDVDNYCLHDETSEERISCFSYRMADAMIKRRNQEVGDEKN